MAFITLNRIERRRTTVFLTCLVVAILTWLAIALSGRYKYKVETRINYIEPPESKAYHPLQDDSVSLEVEGTGWQLLFARLRLNPRAVDVSLKNLSIRNYIVVSNQLNELNRQFESSQRVISVSPDTLFFDFSRRVLRKVPVKLTTDLTFDNTYGISGPVKLTPARVVVNGAAEDVRKTAFWPTTVLHRKKVRSSIVARVSLAPPVGNNVDIYPLTVKAEIPVDKFTEKVIEVPVKVVNAKGRSVKLLPEKVKVTVLVALSNYAAVERESFSAVVDLDDWQVRGASQLPVKFKKFPPYCKEVKTEPQIVDFFVTR
ncbi:YbbR-like domain-containing protein [Arcticibacter sp. MXS-1]|uniref:YbbR-like domain-containing protein n=1 Tax=Arcticibacter sp. MXS-1 TaxID=3341726 RepID=UPI0035A9061B